MNYVKKNKEDDGFTPLHGALWEQVDVVVINVVIIVTSL